MQTKQENISLPSLQILFPRQVGACVSSFRTRHIRRLKKVLCGGTPPHRARCILRRIRSAPPPSTTMYDTVRNKNIELNSIYCDFGTYFTKFRSIANVASLPASPINVRTFVALPVICVEQASRLFSGRLPDLSTKLILGRVGVRPFFITPITCTPSRKINISAVWVDANPVTVVHLV